MKKYESVFRFEKIQIKSIEKARFFSKLLDQMEKEFGVRVCKIELYDCFICPEIESELDTLIKTPMEKHVRDILKKLV